MPYSDGAVSPIRSGPKVPKKKKKKKKQGGKLQFRPKQVKTRFKGAATFENMMAKFVDFQL